MKHHFNHMITVEHKGVSLSFAKDLNRGGQHIYYKATGNTKANRHDDLSKDFRDRVCFPDRLLSIGNGYSLRKLDKEEYLTKPNLPFKVISDHKFIYVFRQSLNGTLLFNRFLLFTKVDDCKKTKYGLEPVFRNSEYDNCMKDAFSVIQPSDNYQSIIEPTIELTSVNKLEDGNFEPLLISDKDYAGYKWQIFVYDKMIRDIRVYSIPMDKNGLLDLGKILDSSPESSASRLKYSKNKKVLPFLFLPTQKKTNIKNSVILHLEGGYSKKKRTSVRMMT